MHEVTEPGDTVNKSKRPFCGGKGHGGEGGEHVKIRSKGCEINREINGGEMGLSAKRKEWKRRGTDMSTLKKQEAKKREALIEREVRRFLFTVVLTLT